MSQIYNPNLKLESEHVVLKSTFSTEKSQYAGCNVTAEKIYDFTKKEDRQELFGKIMTTILAENRSQEFFGNSQTKDPVDETLDIVIKEVKEAFEGLLDELPFR